MESKMKDGIYDFPSITRVEVIDETGRTGVWRGYKNVQLSLQDDGKTLKVFLDQGDTNGKEKIKEVTYERWSRWFSGESSD